MGKNAGQIIGSILQVAAIAAMIIPGVGPALGLATNMLRVVAAAAMIAGGLISGMSAPKPKMPDFDMKFEQGGHMVNTRTTGEPIPVLYGEQRIGGNQVFLTTTGSSNEYLHIIQTIGDSEINSASEVWLDDKLSTDSFYSGHVYTEVFTGPQTQAICQTLKNDFPDWNDAMRGTAYIYVRLKFNRDKFQSVPLITVNAKGRKLYDPRSGQTVWSNNGALALYDMLTNKIYGFGLNSSVINTQSIIDAANKIDTMGYTFNCFINGREPAQDIIDRMLINFRGFLIYTDGVYKLKIYDYDSPVMTLTDDDIIEDSFEIVSPGLPETPNRLKVKFIDPTQKYTVNDFIFEDRDAITLDGMERENELNLIGCTDYDQASEIATFQLERQRLNKTFACAIGSKGNSLELGDIATVTNLFAGWTNQSARVIGIDYLPNYNVGLMLVEDAAALYDKKLNVSPHTWFSGSFPDPLAVPPQPTNVKFSEELYQSGAAILTKVKVTYSIDSLFVESVDVYTSTDGQNFTKYTSAEGGSFDVYALSDVEPLYLKFLPVSIHKIKPALSDVPIHRHKVIGKGYNPSQVVNFRAAQDGQYVNFRWDHIADVDRLGYEIKSGVTFDLGRSVVDSVQQNSYRWRAEKNGTFRFWIKAIDILKLRSQTATSVDITLRGIDENINIIFNQDEITKQGGPSGPLTNLIFNDQTLSLLPISLLTDTDVPDDWTDQDFPGSYAGEDFYTYAYESQVINLQKTGNVSIRLQAAVESTLRDATDEDIPDDWTDDDFVQTDTDQHITFPADYEIYYKDSENNITWSDYKLYQGVVDERIKYIQCKIVIMINSLAQFFELKNFKISLDVEDVKITVSSVAIAVGTGTDIVFSDYYSDGFFVVQEVIPILINDTVSKLPVMSNLTATGCHINLLDTANAKVAGNIQMTIYGY